MKILPYVLDVASLTVLGAAVVIPQWYLQVTQVNLDWTAFFWAVTFPIILACALFIPRKRWVLLLAFLAYIWAFTDDAPVYLDSVFTWPEVTGGFQHLFLEILLHLLTLAFMALTIREALKLSARSGRPITKWKIVASSTLALGAFILAYFQNLPVPWIEFQASDVYWWLPLDIKEHIASITVLFFAILVPFVGRKVSVEKVNSPAPLESEL